MPPDGFIPGCPAAPPTIELPPTLTTPADGFVSLVATGSLNDPQSLAASSRPVDAHPLVAIGSSPSSAEQPMPPNRTTQNAVRSAKGLSPLTFSIGRHHAASYSVMRKAPTASFISPASSIGVSRKASFSFCNYAFPVLYEFGIALTYTHGVYYLVVHEINEFYHARFCTILFCAVLPLVSAKNYFITQFTFEDGVAFSAMFQPGSVLVEGGYVVSRHFAIGSTYLRMMTKDGEIHGGTAHINNLVYRYSRAMTKPISTSSAVVAVDTLKRHRNRLSCSALQLDFETMRFYTALMSRAVSDFEDVSYNSDVPVRVCTYLAPYNSLQSWLVAQGVYTRYG